MALYTDREGDLWAFAADGAGWVWLRKAGLGWQRNGSTRDAVDTDPELGPLEEVQAVPPALDATLLGYIVATISDDMPVIEWSGEPQDTVTEAQTYVTHPGDVVVSVHRLPGSEPTPPAGGDT